MSLPTPPRKSRRLFRDHPDAYLFAGGPLSGPLGADGGAVPQDLRQLQALFHDRCPLFSGQEEVALKRRRSTLFTHERQARVRPACLRQPWYVTVCQNPWRSRHILKSESEIHPGCSRPVVT